MNIPTVRVLLAGALAIVNRADFDPTTMQPFDAEAEAELRAAGVVLAQGAPAKAADGAGAPKVLPLRPEGLADQTKAELVAFAATFGLELDPRATKEVMLAAIDAAYTAAAPAAGQ